MSTNGTHPLFQGVPNLAPPPAPSLHQAATFGGAPNSNINVDDDEFSDDEDPDTKGSDNEDDDCSLLITIDTRTHVDGNNNTISVDPEKHASMIAHNVAISLTKLSPNEGIPMIDENGRPRKIRVKVLAGVRINGTGNVFGEKAIMARLSHANAVAAAVKLAQKQAPKQAPSQQQQQPQKQLVSTQLANGQHAASHPGIGQLVNGHGPRALAIPKKEQLKREPEDSLEPEAKRVKN